MISMDKQYQTRDGRPVRLICVDGNDGRYPVVGFVGDEFGVSTWTNAGFYNNAAPCHSTDLVEVKQMKTVKSLCWRHKASGSLAWGVFDAEELNNWQRFPAGDIEGEVEES